MAIPQFTQTPQNTPAMSGALSPTPSPVRKNPTTLERLAGDVRGHSQLLNSMTIVTTVMGLPPATSVGPMRAFVTDSALTALGNLGIPVAGGGVNTVPVWTDGATGWFIG